jgi:hypothetical protein
MTALRRGRALALGAALLALAAGPIRAQELAGPPDKLVIAWRAPAVPSMPTVTWTIDVAEGQITTVRTEARALFDRMQSESRMYRVIFPMRNVDPFGTIHELEYDRAAVDGIGRLDEGKTVRLPVKSVSIFTQPQTKQQIRAETASATVLTVEKHETIEVPAGRFETIILRLEAETPPSTHPGHRVYRRYWYAPALGWYVRHEVVMTGPQINQRNDYVASKITSEKRAQSR